MDLMKEAKERLTPHWFSGSLDLANRRRRRDILLNHIIDEFLHDDPYSIFNDQSIFDQGNLQEYLSHRERRNLQVEEKKDKITLSMDVTGFKPEELKINVVDNLVTIEGKREVKEEVEGHSKFSWLSFSKSYSLPKGVKSDALECQLDNKWLILTAPKVPSIKDEGIRNIPIQFGGKEKKQPIE